MAEPEKSPNGQGIWRIVKIVLPLAFLLIGFFGVQVWMALDEQNAVKPDKKSGMETDSSRIKTDLAKITKSSGTGSPETPVTLAKTPVGNEQAITSEIPEVVCYRLQVGSFKDPSGAEKLKKKLQEMGYGALVIPSDGQSKVVAMMFFSREQAETVLADMQAHGLSGYPEKVTTPSAMVLLQGGSQRLQSFMDSSLIEIPEMLRELCDYYYLYESQGLDKEAHEAIVLKQIARISDMKTAVENMQIAQEDQGLQTQVKDYLTEYLKYLEKAKKVKSLDRKSLWPGLMDRIEAFGKISAL